MRIAVTGATGFVGHHLVRRLLMYDHEVTAVVHSSPAAGVLDSQVKQVRGSVDDVDSLTAAFDDQDVIVHLVGIIAETKNKTFEKTVAQGTRNVVDAAKKAITPRIIYVSAIGTAKDAPSKYHRTKYEAEEAIKSSGIDFLILRPSLIYGEGDGFISMITKMLAMSPVAPLPGGGHFKMQPVYINDLTEVVARSIDRKDLFNRTVEVAGPDQLAYVEIIRIVKEVTGKKRLNFPVPMPVMKLMAAVSEAVMSPAPLTSDQLKMMAMGNVGDITDMKKLFGVEPISLRDGLSKYLR